MIGPEAVRLGVSQIDGDHGVQIALLRALKDALASAEPDRALELMNELDDYTNAHFLLEETLMIHHDYPGHQAHRHEHDHLISELRTLRNAATDTDETTGAAVADAIEQWLLRHISTFDQAFATFLATGDRETG